jgi:hypothetical protein
VTVVKRIATAEDGPLLNDISGWAHDAELLAARCRFDRKARSVALAFEQEPLDTQLALPQPALTGRSWCASTYRLPFVLCRLHIQRANRWTVPGGSLDPTSLTGVQWAGKESAVVVHTTFGPISVFVDALDVALEITDEIVSVRKRRVGRLLALRFDSTSGPLKDRGEGAP